MTSITEYDGFINNYVKRFNNICSLDPSITTDDLRSEAYEIYIKLSNTKLNCSLITALGRQIEQRFLDLYKVAKRLNSHLDREHFIENLATKAVKVSKLQFDELPPHMKQLVKKIYDNPEVIAEIFPKNHIGKIKLIKFLTRELNWQKKNAYAFAARATRPRREPCSHNATPA